MFGLIAVNHGIARIDTKVAFGFVSVNVSFWPLALMPEMCWVLPARKSVPPAIVFCRSRLTPSGEPIFGLRIRSQAPGRRPR